jgi:hypothetical protein
MDVLFAIMIASMFIVTMGMMLQPPSPNTYLERAVNDIGASLDKSNILNTLNTTLIKNSLNETLLGNTDGAMAIYCYTYNNSYNKSDPTSNEFISNSTYTISNIRNSTKTNPVITGVRYFPTFSGQLISKYCMSRLEVWYT